MYSVFAGIYSATQCQQRDTKRGSAREEETERGAVDAQCNYRPTGERKWARWRPRWERRNVGRSGNIYLHWTDVTWGCSVVCKNCRDGRGTRAYLLNLSSRSVFHYPQCFECPDRLGIVYLLCEEGLVSVFQLVLRKVRMWVLHKCYWYFFFFSSSCIHDSSTSTLNIIPIPIRRATFGYLPVGRFMVLWAETLPSAVCLAFISC